LTLPIPVSYAPMEAKLVAELPRGAEWQYEPKFDGFRCLAHKDGATVDLRSKSGQPFNRYFPEIVTAVEAIKARRCVLDGELVVPEGDTLSFDQLLMRIHPAQSRVLKLAGEHPALFIVFDLLVNAEGQALIDQPLASRRNALETFMARYAGRNERLRLAPAASDYGEVDVWLRSLGAGLDGVIAKRLDYTYRSAKRTGMQKWKRMRTADCVVGGFRYAASGGVVGSLLLGLYDDAGLLHHVGFTSTIKAAEKPALTKKLAKLVSEPGFTGQRPGGRSRWSTERSGEWQPVATELVIEVQYDHFSGGRFRHGTRFLRWRPDKFRRQCTFAQVEQESGSTLALIAAEA
jgi:ATP-dependent DNA ligase